MSINGIKQSEFNNYEFVLFHLYRFDIIFKVKLIMEEHYEGGNIEPNTSFGIPFKLLTIYLKWFSLNQCWPNVKKLCKVWMGKQILFSME